jgi:anti-sigma factor RsiW
MPSERQLADYLAGTLTDEERVAFAVELAAHPEALREVVRQQRLDAALGALLNPGHARVEAAIMASVRGTSDEVIEARVLESTVHTHPDPGWRGWLPNFDGWLSAARRWRSAGAAAALLLLVAAAVVVWIRPWTPSTADGPPAPEVGNTSGDLNDLRDLAPLVAAPPVWTGSEQQSAWLTALAAATAPGGNER